MQHLKKVLLAKFDRDLNNLILLVSVSKMLCSKKRYSAFYRISAWSWAFSILQNKDLDLSL